MTVESIKNLFTDDVDVRKTKIREFVTDKTNSYEDRLEIYKSCPAHLQTTHGWIFHHPTIDDDDWMQYDWWGRNQEIDLTDIPACQEWDDEKAEKFYRGCMDAGIWSFTYDW
jgi:hypothetical protein